MGTRSSTNGRKREILVKQRDQARRLCAEMGVALLNTKQVTFSDDFKTTLKTWSAKLGVQWPA